MRDTERERQRHRQREKQGSFREPNMGLDPGSPGSRPRHQAALNRCATGAALSIFFFLRFYLFIHEKHRDREREREREAETQAEGEAGSMQGA